MAGITINAVSASSATASTEEVRVAFEEHKQELTWLAEFLTDDRFIASMCLAGGRRLSDNKNKENNFFPENVEKWTQEATICSALELKRTRIAELASTYESLDPAGADLPLRPDAIELVVRESDLIRLRLDSIGRFVLILRGIERHSVDFIACLLGISKHAVEAAYSHAIGLLEVIYCQTVLESYECAAA
jgi:hypothetical protein